MPVRDVLAGVLASPLGDHVGNVGDAQAEDERRGGPLPITSSRMGHLLDSLERVLGFEDATGEDEEFLQLMLARIIEPVNKLDSLRASARFAGSVRSRARSSSPCPGARRCRAATFSTSSSTSWAEPMCSTSRDPRRDECTICTAVAPDVVFAVPTYGDTGPAKGRPSAKLQRSRTANLQLSDLSK